MLIECYHCHVNFSRKPSEISNRNFCSRQCLVAANKVDKTLNPNYRGGEEVACHNCGKGTYRVPSKFQQEHHFCSRKCQAEWASRYRIGEKAGNYRGAKHTSSCQLCGKNFEHWGQRLFCSRECASLSQKKINILLCHQCKNKFVRKDSGIYWSQERGYKHYFCSNECSTFFHTGENHPNWIADRSQLKSEVRSIRYSTVMKEWRTSVFRRDDYVCVMCGDRSHKGHGVILNAHHIKRFTDHLALRFDMGNGATLCVFCHDRVTGREKDYEELLLEVINRREEMTSSNIKED